MDTSALSGRNGRRTVWYQVKLTVMTLSYKKQETFFSRLGKMLLWIIGRVPINTDWSIQVGIYETRRGTYFEHVFGSRRWCKSRTMTMVQINEFLKRLPHVLNEVPGMECDNGLIFFLLPDLTIASVPCNRGSKPTLTFHEFEDASPFDVPNRFVMNHQ